MIPCSLDPSRVTDLIDLSTDKEAVHIIRRAKGVEVTDIPKPSTPLCEKHSALHEKFPRLSTLSHNMVDSSVQTVGNVKST